MRKTITLCDLCLQDINPKEHYFVIASMPYPFTKSDIHLHPGCLARWAGEYNNPAYAAAQKIVEQDREILDRLK